MWALCRSNWEQLAVEANQRSAGYFDDEQEPISTNEAGSEEASN